MLLTPLGLNLELLLKMSFRNRDSFSVIKKLPDFYQEIIIAFNKIKSIKPIIALNDAEVFSQCIWGNEYFKLNNKNLYYKNWIESGFIYVKDLFSKDGQFLNEVQILHKLNKKNNWIVEYATLKLVLHKQLKKFNSNICKFIRRPLLDHKNFYIQNKLINITSITTRDMYNALIDKKFERSYAEKMWERKLNLIMTKEDWERVYTMNTKKIQSKKIAEFKYKILLDILPCGQKVNRWNKSVSVLCAYCNVVENISHMLYECVRVKSLWFHIGLCLKMNITLKHVILGLDCGSLVSDNKHLCISMIAYSIFSTWCKCSFGNTDFKNINLRMEIKKHLNFSKEVYNAVLPVKQRLNFEKMLNTITSILD